MTSETMRWRLSRMCPISVRCYPTFHANRVQLTLNYDHSPIDFDPTTGSDTTLDDLLGFTSLCERTVEAWR